MTAPRMLFSGATYLVSRRTLLGRFLLRPDSTCRQLCGYLLAHFAQRHGIVVHAVVFMSNHLHLLCSDPRRTLPYLLRDLHRSLARCLQQHHGFREALWDSAGPSVQLLATAEACADKCAYLLANPARAHLVEHGPQWPGLWGWWGQRHEPTRLTFDKPEGFSYLNGSDWPPRVTLRLLPPGASQLERWGLAEGEQSQRWLQQLVLQRLGEMEAEAKAERAEQRRPVLGAKRARRQNPFGQPSERSAQRRRGKGERHPPIAVGPGWCKGLWKAALMLVAHFRRLYRQALRRWRKGGEARFPQGTWKMSEWPGVEIDWEQNLLWTLQWLRKQARRQELPERRSELAELLGIGWPEEDEEAEAEEPLFAA